ncbi:MAG TPA: polysulfide reductase NrfD [Candidatus Hydrogenedentes bacterium]|nr:polysulfide reductase NrfD [Candidatus Hydrogenedentota bacterium]
MTTHLEFAPLERGMSRTTNRVLLVIGAVGVVAILYRFLFGLGAATNLSNQYPWGVWKAISVAAAVALATGGFTMAALVHVFHRRAYEPLARLALLIGVLGYTFGAASLAVDIGRYYNIWHPAWPTMWQGNSVLFEVAMCIMSYLMILYVEFTPVICERYAGRVALPGGLARWNGAVEALLRAAERLTGRVLSVLLLVGIVLSCMHHSSLGALMLVAPHKMHPFWYTPVLPLLFLLSVLAAGFAVVILVSILTARGAGRRPDLPALSSLSLYVLVFLAVYLVARISDLLIREVHLHLTAGGVEPLWLLIELLPGGLLPLLLLVRRGYATRRRSWDGHAGWWGSGC